MEENKDVISYRAYVDPSKVGKRKPNSVSAQQDIRESISVEVFKMGKGKRAKRGGEGKREKRGGEGKKRGRGGEREGNIN